MAPFSTQSIEKSDWKDTGWIFDESFCVFSITWSTMFNKIGITKNFQFSDKIHEEIKKGR